MNERTKADEIRELGIEAGRENLRERATEAPPPVTRDTCSAYPFSLIDKSMTELIDQLMAIIQPDMHINNPYGRMMCLERLISVAMNSGAVHWYRPMHDYVMSLQHANPR